MGKERSFTNKENAKLHYFSCTLITLWTIGMSLPSTLKTTISPALIGSSWKFVRNSRSPLWKAGSMLPLQTTRKRVCWHKWNKHHEIKEHLILTDNPTVLTEICSFTHSVTLFTPLTQPKSQKAICRSSSIKWRNLDFKRSHTFTAPTNLSGNWAVATDSVAFTRAPKQLEESKCLSPSLDKWDFKFQMYPRGRGRRQKAKQYLDLKQKAFPSTHLSTTTMGLSLPVTTISPFQIIRAEDTIIAKFKTW